MEEISFINGVVFPLNFNNLNIMTLGSGVRTNISQVLRAGLKFESLRHLSYVFVESFEEFPQHSG